MRRVDQSIRIVDRGCQKCSVQQVPITVGRGRLIRATLEGQCTESCRQADNQLRTTAVKVKVNGLAQRAGTTGRTNQFAASSLVADHTWGSVVGNQYIDDLLTGPRRIDPDETVWRIVTSGGLAKLIAERTQAGTHFRPVDSSGLNVQEEVDVVRGSRNGQTSVQEMRLHHEPANESPGPVRQS